ncbi:hypothetical protein TcWFU_000757 [Taenia crassiceps]|uniref:Uncharacterized protein n=1 Tax=Taenia crassiceps TaxID=6207 RepID=A0ABR4QAN9_9CEST
MGSSFSKSSTDSTANTGEGHETTFQQFTNSVRRSFRVKRHNSGNANRSSLRSQTSADGLTNASTRVRPGIPESFHHKTAANVTPATVPKETVEQSAKSPTTPANTKVAAPKAPEVAPAIARVTEAPKNTAFKPESPKDVKREEERKGEMNKAMDMLKGAISAGEEQVEKKNDKKTEEIGGGEEEKLHHVGNILSQLAPTDISDDKSPETDTPKKPVVSLMAALEKRRMEKEKEEEKEEDDEENKDSTLTHGVTNVLESIAAQSLSVKSKEAAVLMSAFTLPPQPQAEVRAEEQKEKEEKKDKEEKKEEEEEVKPEEDKRGKEEVEENEHQKEGEGKKVEEDEGKKHQEEKERGREGEDEKYEEWKEEKYN